MIAKSEEKQRPASTQDIIKPVEIKASPEKVVKFSNAIKPITDEKKISKPLR